MRVTYRLKGSLGPQIKKNIKCNRLAVFTGRVPVAVPYSSWI